MVLAVLVLSLALLTARAVVDGERELAASNAAFDAGNLDEATAHARRAAASYAPGAPHVDRAYERLVAIGVGAEAAGQTESARAAWSAVRAASLASRHLWVARPELLARANESLARLDAAGDPTTPPAERRAAIESARRDLQRDDAPSGHWLIVLALGFGFSLLGLSVVALRAVTPEGEVRLGRAKLGAVLTLLGAAAWTLAVMRA